MKNLCEPDDLEWFRRITGVDQEHLLSLTLSAIAPYQPGSLRQKLRQRQEAEKRDPSVVPSTEALWRLFEAADFRCSLCKSQLSISIDRIDPKAGYDYDNMRVVCRDCNRKLSRPGSIQQKLNLKVFRAIRDCLLREATRFPTDMEIKDKAAIKELSDSTYLVRYIRYRWEQANQIQSKV